MKVKGESEVIQLCPTLSDPVDCSLPRSSIQGIFQARVLEWGAIVLGTVLSSSTHLVFKNNTKRKMVIIMLILHARKLRQRRVR